MSNFQIVDGQVFAQSEYTNRLELCTGSLDMRLAKHGIAPIPDVDKFAMVEVVDLEEVESASGNKILVEKTVHNFEDDVIAYGKAVQREQQKMMEERADNMRDEAREQRIARMCSLMNEETEQDIFA